jgi:hypothetical protein
MKPGIFWDIVGFDIHRRLEAKNAFSFRQTTTTIADICSVFIRHYINTWRRTVKVVMGYQMTARSSFPGKVQDIFLLTTVSRKYLKIFS